MKFDYAEVASVAAGLIDDFGAAATLVRVGSPVYDPATGLTGPGDAFPEPVVAVVFDYDQKMIDGSLIQSGDKQAFVSVVGLTVPRTSDAFWWVGKIYTIIMVKALAPAGVPVLYELQIRGSGL